MVIPRGPEDFTGEQGHKIKGGAIMGDKGQKDKNKHNKQVNIGKDKKNEAKTKKQEKTH